ncbi:hypothetical protein ACHAXM_001562 [Skeletonema potamos]
MPRWRMPVLLSSCVVIWFGIQAALFHRFSAHLSTEPGGSYSSHIRQHHDLDSRVSKYNLTLSSHMKKTIVPDDNRMLAFLHIGKTGGSTISVNIRHGCHDCCMQPCSVRTDGWIHNETILSQRIQSYYHMESIPLDKLNKQNQITTIVTTVRNPISRFISAFAYEHPLNDRATKLTHNREVWEQFSCFPNLSYLVKAAMGRAEIRWNKAHTNALREQARQANTVQFGKLYSRPKPVQEIVSPINCTKLAVLAFGRNETPLEIHESVVNGSHPFVNHMSYDYRQYYLSMPPEKELFVLRHEHLWNDWEHVNHLLGMNNPKYYNWHAVPPFQRVERNVSHQYVAKERWKLHDRQEQRWLCHLLHDEIRTYLMIIMRAVNLNENDLSNAISDIDRACPVV